MIAVIDHVVILVDDLRQAQADYTALGFTVVEGGEHAGGLTHNALVAFADGTYLELLAFRGAPPPADAPGLNRLTRRWIARAPAGEGLLDFALLPTAIAGDIAAAVAAGLDIEGPLPGGRRRPDGQEVAWQLGLPAAPELPFLCGDVTPRALRVPEGGAAQHANGIRGIAGMTVAVADLGASAARYAALLGAEPLPDVEAGGTITPLAVFPLHGMPITLVAPYGPDDPLRGRLARRGAGPYALRLFGPSGGDAGSFDLALTHGASIQFQPA
jgi:catechol 2,3-dioxygenase-like lactoylglutathione lyase family enzyme